MFKERSQQKELLDEEYIPTVDLFRNLKELDIINALLGGYRMTFSALNRILVHGKQYNIVDIGSGGSDTLKRISKWNEKNNFDISLYGIDIKQTCIDYATADNSNSEIKYICDDYRNIGKHLAKVDIIHASLFCHHLTDKEIIDLIQLAQDNNSVLIINDLQRNAFAHYSIKYITRLLSKSYLVKNDAPLSVLRGFKLNEWKAIIQESGAKNYTIRYRWAFRHEVIIYAS